MKKKYIYLIIVIVLIPILYLSTIIFVGTVTDYKPEERTEISSIKDNFFLSDTISYKCLIWNIGYAGLGANMDFFYDGGENVRDTKDNTFRNFHMIKKFLMLNERVDFILLQEVDQKSKRSYKIDQVDQINLKMAGHFPFFASNYKSFFVPLPFFKPLGQVNSGLLTLTAHIPQKTTRFSFPGNYSWPKSCFMLDRCFMVNRYLLKNGKEFVLINTHNSAYDDGSLREAQMNYLKDFLINEEKLGNYVIVGGDWNQSPPGFQDKYKGHVFDTINLNYISDDFLNENWNWIFDSTEPTNRRVTMPFEQGKCPVTLIDFYLVSSNIEVLSIETIPMEFAYSDHQPVYIEFKFR